MRPVASFLLNFVGCVIPLASFSLFSSAVAGQVHKWVNFESMLEKCLIGKVVGPAVQIRKCELPLATFLFLFSFQCHGHSHSETVLEYRAHLQVVVFVC